MTCACGAPSDVMGLVPKRETDDPKEAKHLGIPVREINGKLWAMTRVPVCGDCMRKNIADLGLMVVA